MLLIETCTLAIYLTIYYDNYITLFCCRIHRDVWAPSAATATPPPPPCGGGTAPASRSATPVASTTNCTGWDNQNSFTDILNLSSSKQYIGVNKGGAPTEASQTSLIMQRAPYRLKYVSSLVGSAYFRAAWPVWYVQYVPESQAPFGRFAPTRVMAHVNKQRESLFCSLQLPGICPFLSLWSPPCPWISNDASERGPRVARAQSVHMSGLCTWYHNSMPLLRDREKRAPVAFVLGSCGAVFLRYLLGCGHTYGK